jgi:hypothetical protein
MSEIELGHGASRNGHPPVLCCFICDAPVSSPEGVFSQPGVEGARNFGVCDAHLERGPSVAWDGDGLPVLIEFRDEQATTTKEEPMNEMDAATHQGAIERSEPMGAPDLPSSPYMQATQRLDAETELLSRMVERLQARLEPTLLPIDHPEQHAGGVPRETNPVGIAELVEVQADRVSSANRRLQELHDRIGF